MPKQITLGRGELAFGDTLANTTYFGNTPEFSLTIDSESLDHFDSDHGIREKDDSVPLETNRTGAFITDDIQLPTVALFFFGTHSIIVQAPVTLLVTPEEFTVGPRSRIQLGVEAARPQGYRGIDATGFEITGTGGTPTYVNGVDYVLHLNSGTVYFPESGAIAADTDIEVVYAVAGSTFPEVLSGATPRQGALRFIAFNPKGQNVDYAMPLVNIRPNGDYQMKGDDWQQIPFSLEILKPADAEAIYANGTPVYA